MAVCISKRACLAQGRQTTSFFSQHNFHTQSDRRGCKPRLRLKEQGSSGVLPNTFHLQLRLSSTTSTGGTAPIELVSAEIYERLFGKSRKKPSICTSKGTDDVKVVMKSEIKQLIFGLAQERLAELGAQPEIIKNDPWMRGFDWTTQSGDNKPNWYGHMLTKLDTMKRLTNDMQICVSSLMRLSWCGRPLVYNGERGFGSFVDVDIADPAADSTSVHRTAFVPLKRPGGYKLKQVVPFDAHFVDLFHSGELASESPAHARLLIDSICAGTLFGVGSSRFVVTDSSAGCESVRTCLPPASSASLMERLEHISAAQVAPVKRMVNELVNSELQPFPTKWEYFPGWRRYESDGSTVEVAYPDADALVFDVETCMEEGLAPTLAVAVSTDHWYSWCSECLFKEESNAGKPYRYYELSELIPLGNSSDKPRLVIGHNVGYDRARVKEAYLETRHNLKFLDTMSMHLSCNGVAGGQEALYRTDPSEVEHEEKRKWMEEWRKRVSPSNLKNCHEFWCGASSMSKDDRNIFVKGTLEDVRQDFQKLMIYCANDVKATFEVLQQLWPRYCERFPKSATLSGQLEMLSAYLPVNDNWFHFIDKCEKSCREAETEIEEMIVSLAESTIERLTPDKRYEKDPWMWDQDWTIKKSTQKPKWYEKLRSSSTVLTVESRKTSLRSQLVPRLLQLTWRGVPLQHMTGFGWGCFVPTAHAKRRGKELEDTTFVYLPGSRNTERVACPIKEFVNIGNRKDWTAYKSIPTFSDYLEFVKLPHPDGGHLNTGNPLSKLCLAYLESGEVASADAQQAMRIVSLLRNSQYWHNAKGRIEEQLVVRVRDTDSENGKWVGAIVPQLAPAGTVTRRAVEKLWLTASNPKKDRIGSELKAMVQSSDGYTLVGADVDSQEQWIAALLGDHFERNGTVGSTGFSRMVLAGQKEDQSDLHSVIARDVGIERDHAKVLNYGRLYGAGAPFAKQLLKRFCPLMHSSEISKKVNTLYSKTKGVHRKMVEVRPEFEALFWESMLWKKGFWKRNGQRLMLSSSAKTINLKNIFEKYLMETKRHPGPETNVFGSERLIWSGGYESTVFNCLEYIVEFKPETPVLKCRLSDALLLPDGTVGKEHFDATFKRSKVNWVVQSSAVDFLHLLLVCMRWLIDEHLLQNSIRFVISIHDEIWYLCADEDKYKCAQLLQLSNLLTRAVFSQALGIEELPQTVAFFSGVNVDRVLRKEPYLTCTTPSCRGVLEEFGIPPGEVLTMGEIEQKLADESAKTIGAASASSTKRAYGPV